MPSIAVTDKPEDLGFSSSRLARIGPFFEQAYVAPGRLPGVLTLVALVVTALFGLWLWQRTRKRRRAKT